MKFIVKKDEVNKVANELLQIARSFKKDSAVVVALSGELGAGKTALTQEVARILDVKEKVISPTFVIMKRYKINQKKINDTNSAMAEFVSFRETFKNLIHIDAYRLDKSSELINLGWEELSGSKDNLIIVEWPERVLDCTKNSDIKISLKHIDEETRSFDILL